MPARKPEPFLSLGFAAVDWIEHYLVHGPGDVQGKPVEVDDEFAAFDVKAYQVDARGNRKVRRSFLSRPKGRAKSEHAAMLACFEALGPCRFDHFADAGEVSPWGYEYEPGEPVGQPLAYVEILNVATEEDQAGNTYDAIYYMLNPETCSPELLRDYGKIDIGLERTNLPHRRGRIEPVTSADSSKDGAKSTFIVADETHLWLLPRLKRLHGIMTRNLLKRKVASGWMLETSTMYGEGEDSVAEGTHAYAVAVSAGRRNDRTLLFDHRQASDRWDLAKRGDRMQALREVYGPAAEWSNLDPICDSWEDPQVSEAEWRRFWLNQPVAMTLPQQWQVISEAVWRARAGAVGRPSGAVAFALSAAWPAAEWGSIAVAGRNGAEVFGQLVERRPGTSWMPARMKELQDEWHPVATLLDDKKDPAAREKAALEAAGVELTPVNMTEAAQAFGEFIGAVAGDAPYLRHYDQPELNAAVAAAQKRKLGDAHTWDRQGPTDISPVIALTNALHGLLAHADQPFFAAWR